MIVLGLIIYGILFSFIFQLLVLVFDLYARKYGAFYASSQRVKVDQMIQFAQPLKGKQIVDLGSGDGKLVIAFARAGAKKVIGYEINPFLVFLSRMKIKLLGLSKHAAIYYQNYWEVSLSDADIVVLYGIPWMMEKLEKKLRSELKQNTRVISNMFPFPHWKYKKLSHGVYLYEKY